EQLIRQHRLLQILERTRYGRTLSELRDDIVDELGLTSLHTRSIRRDLEALQAAGFDVMPQEVARGRVWKLGPQHKGMHKLTVSATELTALSLGRDLLLPLAGTPFWVGIETFWNKVQEALPEPVLKHYQKYRRFLHVLGSPAKSYDKFKGILSTVNRAILEHRVMEIDYCSLSAERPSRRRIRPYAVVLYQSSLYIVAEACEDDSIRHLKLDRFSKAEALDEWFKPRADFNVKEYLATSLGIFAGSQATQFRIKISPLAARWVREDPWHPEQQIKERADGSLILTVRATHELEVIPKVLALGSEAEILAPKSARESIRATVKQMAKHYREPK
ncbi:MAG: WYL domain-containing protein, partial [Planctomycetota bacterium]